MKTINNTKTSSIKKYTVALLMAILLLPLTSIAQDIFSKYDGNIDVTYVDIKPKMFQMLAKMDVKVDDLEAQDYIEMVNSITSLRAIVTGEKTISTDISTWVDSRSKNLEELMEMRDDGTVVKFFIKEGKDEDHVEELLIFVNGISNQMNNSDAKVNGKDRSIETVVVSLTGNIDLKKLNFDLIGDQVQSKQGSTDIFSNENMVFKDLKIYPNPSQDVVTIDLPSQIENDVTITVLNSQGKQVHTQVINAENNNLNVSNLQTGVYLIQIAHDDSRIVKRFVKQ